jgi:hypothetical protein
MKTSKYKKVSTTVSFPEPTHPELYTKDIVHSGTTSQGYLRRVFKKEGRVYIYKTIDKASEHIYPKTLIPKLDEENAGHLAKSFNDQRLAIINFNEENAGHFAKSFNDQRLAIIDFEGLFFYHYAQVLSSIKASYMDKLAKDSDESQASLARLPMSEEAVDEASVDKAFDDKAFDDAFSSFNELFGNVINKKFQESVLASINDDNTVDVSKLNGLLNDAISPLKTKLDQELKHILNDSELPTSAGKFRETTSAFGAPATEVTITPLENDSEFIETIESTTITAHDKKNGPAVSKVTMAIKQKYGSETVVFEAYRTSHLVSKPTKSGYAHYISAAVTVAAIIGVGVSFGFPPLGIALVAVGAALLVGIAVNARIIAKKEEKNILKTKNIIEQFMDNNSGKSEIVDESDSGKPMIYNLLTSTHASEYSLVGMYDAVSNKQTSRLKTLANAQYEFNMEKNLIKDMFFVLNTPTNTFGREISLTEFPKNKDAMMHRVAQSNLISLAILLYGHEDKGVAAMVDAYKKLDSDNFISAYGALKAENPYASEDLKIAYAQKFILARFKEDSAAKHEFAKETASYVGILSRDRARLIIGCKSGNERTGGILGRIATFISSAFWDSPQSSGQKPSEDDLAEHAPEHFDLNKEYNEKGCNSSSVTTISRLDQGSDPKTEAKSEVILNFTNFKTWLFQNHNTNKTEPKENTNIQTHGVASLQAHKDKSFKK